MENQILERVKYPSKDVKMATPWGTSDYKIQYERGVFRINTPGHGGIAVSKAKAAKLFSQKALELASETVGGYVFFEEDCAVCVAMLDSDVILTHVAASHGKSKEEIRSDAEKSVTRWYPQYINKQ